MEKDRRIKILSIVALVLAITGMSLGFAAFTSTLTISSSATVTPNSDDFKIVAYGIPTDLISSINSIDELIDNKDIYTSPTNSYPVMGDQIGNHTTPKSASVANITSQSNNIIINNMMLEMSKSTDAVYYAFLVKNEGLYDVYMSFQHSGEEQCTAQTEMTPNMTNSCNYFYRDIYVYTSSGEEANLRSQKIPINDYIIGIMEMKYSEAATVWPDGNINFKYKDVIVNFTTTPPSN